MKEKIKAIIKKHETKTKDVYIDKGIDANHYDEFIADLAKLFVIGVVSNNEVAVCDCKAPAFRDEHGNHRCTECNELCNTD